MAPPVATKLYINEVPVQHIRPFQIRLSRGWEPWRFAVGVTDDRFDNLQNPVTLRIETVGEDGVTPVSATLEKWYITGKVRHDEWEYDLIVQDVRWTAQYAKFSGSFNVEWWGSDNLRQGSSDQGGDHTVIGAVQEALEGFGLDVGLNLNLKQEIKDLILPRNLSASPGGGFGGASYLETMPLLAESAELDIVPREDGSVIMVDRTSDVSRRLVNFNVTGGRVEDRNNHWSQPKRLEVLFPKRVERQFDYVEENPAPRSSSGADTTYEGDGVTNNIENVIPVYDAAIFTNRHDEFYAEVRDKVQYRRLNVLDRIHAPGIFPWGSKFFMRRMDAAEYAKHRWFETAMQDTWRRRFRVKQELLGVGEVMRPLAGLKLGRLSKDGTTSGVGGVYMNYTRINRYSHYPPGKGPDQAGGTIFDAIFSDNFGFDELISAPFDAQWMTEDVDELIFEVNPRVYSRLERNYWPGELRGTGMQYGDINDIANGKPIERMEGSVEFSTDFHMQVYYHGLQIADLSTSAEDARMHRIRFDNLFPQGEGPTLQIKAGNITANYAFNESNDLPRESDIINQEELDEAAEFIAEEIRNSYAVTKHGSVSYGTVAPLAGGVTTDGDIFDTVIQFGVDEEFTCTLTYLIMPGIPQVTAGRDARAGRPAAIVDGGR